MQLCTLWGNMSADRTDEQYPQANVCDECIQKYSTAEESPIVHINGSYESVYGEECALCEKHISEEQSC
ncbi:hypothetical protein [Acinetobacter sp. Ver3]|jgi:hypothetical protein|uniref:hypothetical protein n=1 Tax=Acinetobacter sp. Ver3 TaxID=466088 RepID=UPI00044731FD|nr:hypothetical protein [Acinetobacter sp. Ver3]EZQ00930.1 hypothetical protein CL42_16460 [Acinetobacter sp. Ver3]